MRRKILDMLWQWKKTENGRVALLIEGAWQTRVLDEWVKAILLRLLPARHTGHIL